MSITTELTPQQAYVQAAIKKFVAEVKKGMPTVTQVKLRDDYEFNTMIVVPQSECASACLAVELEPTYRPNVVAALSEAGIEVLSSNFGFGSSTYA